MVVSKASCIDLAILVAVGALTVFCEIYEFTLVALFAFYQNPETFDLVGFPFPNIGN
jgi:hypothetical protein